MATAKKKKPAKRRHKGLSAPHRSVKRRRNKGLFDGGFSKDKLLDNAKTAAMGALGGVGASFANKATTGFKWGFWGKSITGAIGGFAIAAFGAPRMGAGFAGGMSALATTDSGLHDDDDGMNDELEDNSIYETSDGSLVRMLNDGSLEPLNDDEIQALNDGNYPEYSTMNRFQTA